MDVVAAVAGLGDVEHRVVGPDEHAPDLGDRRVDRDAEAAGDVDVGGGDVEGLSGVDDRHPRQSEQQRDDQLAAEALRGPVEDRPGDVDGDEAVALPVA